MVIGGIRDGNPSNKTYIYNAISKLWSEGPELNVPRSDVSCSTFTNPDDSQKIIVAGGYNNDGILSSSEVRMAVFLLLQL